MKRNTPDHPVDIEGQNAFYWGGPFSNFTYIPAGIVVQCTRLNLPATRFFTVEHAYQASKALNSIDYCAIADTPTPAAAKRLGNKINMRPGWQSLKTDIMLRLCRKRLEADPSLAALLVHLTSQGYKVRERHPEWGPRTGYIWATLARELTAPIGCDRCGTEDTGRFNPALSDVRCVDCLDQYGVEA